MKSSSQTDVNAEKASDSSIKSVPKSGLFVYSSEFYLPSSYFPKPLNSVCKKVIAKSARACTATSNFSDFYLRTFSHLVFESFYNTATQVGLPVNIMVYGESPLITVGVVVRNREWIIGKMLNALLSQTYPHGKIYVLIVDANSSDKTVEIAENILKKGDFKGYKIIVKECSIPEGRNLCIENMQGDALLYWDSDVIMDSDVISLMVKAMNENKAEIVDVNCVEIFVNSVQDIDAKIKQAKIAQNQSGAAVHVVSATGMGHTLVAKAVFNNLRFDPDLTICEDLEFSYRAGKKGYKLISLGHVLTFDVNMWKKGYSDTHIDMPLKYAAKGIRKKAKIQVLTYNTTINAKSIVDFFLKNKRYIFYLGYIPAAFLTVCGLFLYLPLTSAFPIYLAVFAILQIRKRGFARGLQSTLRSIIIGIPYVLALIFYFIKRILWRAPKTSHGQSTL